MLTEAIMKKVEVLDAVDKELIRVCQSVISHYFVTTNTSFAARTFPPEYLVISMHGLPGDGNRIHHSVFITFTHLQTIPTNGRSKAIYLPSTEQLDAIPLNYLEKSLLAL